MALANGDVVSPHLASGTVKAQPQPPKFGVVDDDGTGVNVLWEDGSLVSGITGTSLDKILPAGADAISGQRVFVNIAPSASFQASADYQGLVVDLYQRDQNGAGSPTAVLALVKLISTGLFVEVPTAQCQVIPGGS